MKRLNQKGFSTVELLVCFIIVTTIVISMFDLIMNYKNRQQVESINSEMVTYKNTVTKTIEDDIVNNGGMYSVTQNGNILSFTFRNGVMATLSFETDGETKGSITYQGEIFLTDDIPDMTFRLTLSEEDSNSLLLQTCEGSGTFRLGIPFSHPDLMSAMGIYLTVPCGPLIS